MWLCLHDLFGTQTKSESFPVRDSILGCKTCLTTESWKGNTGKIPKSMMVRMLRSCTFFTRIPPIHDDLICCMLFCELCYPKKSWLTCTLRMVNPHGTLTRIPRVGLNPTTLQIWIFPLPGLGTCSAALFSLFGGELLGCKRIQRLLR